MADRTAIQIDCHPKDDAAVAAVLEPFEISTDYDDEREPGSFDAAEVAYVHEIVEALRHAGVYCRVTANETRWVDGGCWVIAGGEVARLDYDQRVRINDDGTFASPAVVLRWMKVCEIHQQRMDKLAN